MQSDFRQRRLRENKLLRELVAEVKIDKTKLIMPHFVVEGEAALREPISSMPGIDRVSIDNLIIDLEKDYQLGMKYILLFGIPAHKDDQASSAYAENGIIQQAVRKIKEKFKDIYIITDVCLCEYMLHGHCGIVKDNRILNDPSLELLARTALSHVKAGADMAAPSDMMDGRIEAIRTILDSKGFVNTPLMSYAVKYASAFYGPFREAAGSAPQFGDRKSYQMDYRNLQEAEREVEADIKQGADIVMVKPALAYLDIISRVKRSVNVPVCAYNVSGEYSMVKASAAMKYANEHDLVREIITATFRAGADMLISYHTRDIFKNNWF